MANRRPLSDERAGEGAISSALTTIIADMVEAALVRDSKAALGVASTKGRRAANKESAA